MKFPDKKRLLLVGVGALIITTIVNFPHLMNIISSDPPPMPRGEDFMRGGPHKGEMMFKSDFQIFQYIWYYIFSFITLYITSQPEATEIRTDSSNKQRSQTIIIQLLKIIAVVIAFYVVENLTLRQMFDNHDFKMRRQFDTVLLGRYVFVVTIAYLTGILFKMMDKQNSMLVENEQLRSENLQIRYNALANQMNPHFLFNSLNSLQYLLIDKEYSKSITYINELSTVFRYILQSSKKELVTLQEELDFLKAYRFLLNIRFEQKIQFIEEIQDKSCNYKLPVLSIQPLVENAIKHNACSLAEPLIIRIYTKENKLYITNNIIPKVSPENGSGIGLDNLNKRFQLLLNCNIEIHKSEKEFTVILPLKIA